MRPSTRPLRSLLATSSLLLLAALISCGDGKPSRKDRHHDDHASVDATQAPSQSDPTDDGKKGKHKHDKDKKDDAAAATDAASSAPAGGDDDTRCASDAGGLARAFLVGRSDGASSGSDMSPTQTREEIH